MKHHRHPLTSLRRNADRRREQDRAWKVTLGLFTIGFATLGLGFHLDAKYGNEANWSLIARLDGQEYVQDTGTREDCLAWVSAKEKLWGTNVVFYCAKERKAK